MTTSVIDLLFIFVWLMLPLVWHILLRTTGLSLLRPTLPSFTIVALYIYQYIGIPVLYFQFNEYRLSTGVNNPDLVLLVWAYTSITITLMIAGFILAHSQFGSLRGFATEHYKIDMSQKQLLSMTILGVISCMVLYLYITKVGIENIALFVALDVSGSDLSAEAARSAMGNSFAGKYHRYQWFMHHILMFVVLALYAQLLLKSSKLIRLLLFIFGIALLFSLLMAIEKGPIANFLIALLLVFVWVRNNGRVPLTLVAKFGLFIVSTLVLAYIYFMNVSNIGAALSSIASRAFTGQIQPAYHYLEYFPMYQDWLMGRSFPNPAGLFPFEPFALTTELMHWKNPALQEMGVTGSMPTVYWGELYANFGVFGVLVLPLVAGYLLYAGNYFMFKQKFSPVSISLFVWLLMHYKALSSTGLSGFIVDVKLVILIFIFVLIEKVSFHKRDTSVILPKINTQ